MQQEVYKLAEGVTLSTADGSVHYRSRRTVILHPTELKILLMLAQSRGEVVLRGTLLKAIGHSPDCGSRVVDVHVGNIRKKIETDRRKPTIIVTAVGFGYMVPL